jgi:hypothetical protein
MVLWAADVHAEYQSGLNVESLARESYSAMVVKATQGSGGYWAPGRFDDWIRRGRASGMVVGAYHWLMAGSGRAQADYYLSRVAGHVSDGPLVLAVDNEDTSSPASVATLADFVARVRQVTGRPQLLHYSGAWWAGSRLADVDLPAMGLIGWDSKYVVGTGYASTLYQSVPANWWVPGYGQFARSKMLQFSSSGIAGGLAGNIDVNAWDGTRAELEALAGGQEMALDGYQTAQLWNAQNTLACVVSMVPNISEQGFDGVQGTQGVRHNDLRDVLIEIRDLARGITPGAPTPEQWGELTERVTAELRVAVAATVEQALQPIRQGLGEFGARLETAADALGRIDDEGAPA